MTEQEKALPSRETERDRQAAPGEVVEYYRPRQPREITEVYTRPLPPRLRPTVPPEQKKKRSRRGLCIFLVCVAVIAGLTVIACLLNGTSAAVPFASSGKGEAQTESQEVEIPLYQPDETVTVAVERDHGPELTAQEVYAVVNPAVVTVQTQLHTGVSIGTGILFTSDGYLLTNYHVVEGGDACTVLLADDRVFTALYVAGDRDNDLAVLKIDGQDLPTAVIGNSDALTVGDKVYAIGNPLGVGLRGTFTDGIISAIDRNVTVEGREMTLVQTNAALNSGNSGGPLLNVYGQVIGINTVKMSSSFSSVEGLGFAIPSCSVQGIVNDLLEYGEVLPEGRLGLSVLQIGTTLDDGNVGVEVVEVTTGSAADRAGVQVGDFVLCADGTPIHTSSALLQVRRRFNAGDPLTLTLWRDGEIFDVTLYLDEMTLT